ncbi:MSHA biogenesis protein MshP [Vibrio algivorus]|uniref:MSHA biogenesis protein MshP n=1 Tax=Vibrio algivorus TaxID=1667024 RepID=A0ABQ6EQN5_9VIBR|nr:MSHA biogenesis protein MshP [Vibrio algivorus]GLT15061.1 MSHA biogenesis protein MshP [Vibrio algivorus]
MNKIKQAHSSLASQSGSVLIVVIFVVVVMGLLASTMARLEWSNQDTQSREIMGNRAWFMAHSANEWAMTQLFPLGETGEDLDKLSSYCTSSLTFPNGYFANDAEYQHCQIDSLTCTPHIMTDSGGSEVKYGFFKVSAKASCGDDDGLFRVERAQDIVVTTLK